jgi:hypothetical protein
MIQIMTVMILNTKMGDNKKILGTAIGLLMIFRATKVLKHLFAQTRSDTSPQW